MALVNGGFLYYTDMKKFLKNLVLRNRCSDFEIISQESLTICEPAWQVKFLVCYCQFGSLLQIPVVFGL